MSKSYQQQYAEILRKLINEPEKIGVSRVGNVRSRFVETIRVDLRKEFPLMEIKKVSFKNILHELLWFIKGNTNIKYLVENKCNIWNDDAYRYFNEKYAKYVFPENNIIQLNLPFKISKEDFLKNVLSEKTVSISEFEEYTYGDLDRVYGFQWRMFNNKTDQLVNVINTLKTNPDDRRMIVTAHNPTDLREGNVGLPSCHNYFQFYTSKISKEERESLADKYDGIVDNVPERYISIYYNIRSNDFFLGQPYNTPSYSLLLMMVAEVVGMIPKEVVCNAVDCHLYESHLGASEEWLSRYEERFNGGSEREKLFTYSKAKVELIREVQSIDGFIADDFILKNYNPDKPIKATLLT